MEKIFLNKGHDYCTSYVASLFREIFAVPTVLLSKEHSTDYYHYLFKIRFPHILWQVSALYCMSGRHLLYTK